MLTIQKRPGWLNKKINLKECGRLRAILKDLELNTVCEEALCPNISECFSKDTAAFMILGDTCTRSCHFCAVKKGEPSSVDLTEPERIAEAVKRLNLKYIVITSVTRDDLGDGGAGVFANTIQAIRDKVTDIKIEVLIPDFKLNIDSINKVLEAGPDVINHNIETVPRLYKELRPCASYKQSLMVLKKVKEFGYSKQLYSKSGLMVGLGETAKEVLEVLADLRDVNCDLLSIGQYLSPGESYYPVKEYIPPDRFDYYKEEALNMGFLHVESGPYIRSSYCASEYLGK